MACFFVGGLCYIAALFAVGVRAGGVAVWLAVAGTAQCTLCACVTTLDANGCVAKTEAWRERRKAKATRVRRDARAIRRQRRRKEELTL